MNYQLRKAVLFSSKSIELSKEEYDALATARAVLTNAFAIEEKYEIVISNYLDLEKSILYVAAQNMVRQTIDYSDFYDIRSSLNIRVVNLLTATKLYIDQISQHLKHCTEEAQTAEVTIKRRCSEEYDAKYEYRFMEAFRNHVQHRGLAVHSAGPSWKWSSRDESGQLVVSTNLKVIRRYLEEDAKFKKSVLSETPDEVDLLAAIRAYIESISAIHETARGMIADVLSKARILIEAQHSRYSQVDPEKTTGLEAVALEGATAVSAVPLLLEWDDVRMVIMQRNPELKNLHKRYASSELKRNSPSTSGT